MTTVQRWTGREARALRSALRLSVRGFAATLGVGVRTVADWDAGGVNICPRPEMQAALDTALSRADEAATARFRQLLQFAATEEVEPATAVTPAESTGLLGLSGDTWDHDASAALACFLAADHKLTVLPNGNKYASAMRSFRAADRHVGGGHLYATVVRYLHAEVAPRLFGVDHDNDGQILFTAAAALTEMAGWMAHDAGRDHTAQQHFARSLDLVKIGGDHQLGVHILASMSHLAHHLNKPANAIQLARRGRETLARGPQQPELEAQLLAMQARGFAALRRAEDCMQLLLEAERTLAVTPTEARSPWVSHFDEASLASEVARCLRQLGDLSEAQRQAERIIELRPGDRTRSRAFGQLTLAAMLVARDKADEACVVVQEVLETTQQLGSYLVIQQLLDLRQRLELHRANKAVADFLLCLDGTLRERAWLCRWLTKDMPGRAAGLGERS